MLFLEGCLWLLLKLERNSNNTAFTIWCHFLFANLPPNCSSNESLLDSSQFYDGPLNKPNKHFNVNICSGSLPTFSNYPGSILTFASGSNLIPSLLLQVDPYDILSSLNLCSICFCNSYFGTKLHKTLQCCCYWELTFDAETQLWGPWWQGQNTE